MMRKIVMRLWRRNRRRMVMVMRRMRGDEDVNDDD